MESEHLAEVLAKVDRDLGLIGSIGADQAKIERMAQDVSAAQRLVTTGIQSTESALARAGAVADAGYPARILPPVPTDYHRNHLLERNAEAAEMTADGVEAIVTRMPQLEDRLEAVERKLPSWKRDFALLVSGGVILLLLQELAKALFG
jgi:hypothetical protein